MSVHRPVVSFTPQALFPGGVLGTTDLSIHKFASADPVSTGSAFSYHVAVVNNGPDDAAGVTMTDTLPAGVTFVSATPSQGTCDHASGTVTCDLETILAFELATVEIAVTAPAVVGPITNTASVSTTDTDPDPSNNTATVDTTVVAPGADLALEKFAEPDPAATSCAADLHARGHEPRAG